MANKIKTMHNELKAVYDLISGEVDSQVSSGDLEGFAKDIKKLEFKPIVAIDNKKSSMRNPNNMKKISKNVEFSGGRMGTLLIGYTTKVEHYNNEVAKVEYRKAENALTRILNDKIPKNSNVIVKKISEDMFEKDIETAGWISVGLTLLSFGGYIASLSIFSIPLMIAGMTGMIFSSLTPSVIVRLKKRFQGSFYYILIHKDSISSSDLDADSRKYLSESVKFIIESAILIGGLDISAGDALITEAAVDAISGQKEDTGDLDDFDFI